jgi:hypothetical protein
VILHRDTCDTMCLPHWLRLTVLRGCDCAPKACANKPARSTAGKTRGHATPFSRSRPLWHAASAARSCSFFSARGLDGLQDTLRSKDGISSTSRIRRPPGSESTHPPYVNKKRVNKNETLSGGPEHRDFSGPRWGPGTPPDASGSLCNDSW